MEKIETLTFNEEKFRYGIKVHKLTQQDLHGGNKLFRPAFYRMMWVCKGNLRLNIDLANSLLEKDQCVFIGKNQVVQFSEENFFEAYIVDFTESFYARTTQDLDFLKGDSIFNNPLGTVEIQVEEPYKKTLLDFVKFFQKINKKKFDILLYQIAHNTLERILLYAEWHLKQNKRVQLKPSRSKEFELVKNLKTLINHHYSEHKNVGFYAGLLNVPAKKLNKACRQARQGSPKTLILERILLEAKRQLKYSEMSIKEISWMMGYDQPNSFIKLFITYEGQTPMNFRNNFRKEIV